MMGESQRSSSSSPGVSVVVPAYNAERFLAQTLDSVLGQSFGDFELIVVDDGSTDGTAALVERFGEADSRVQLLRQSNAGVSAARNFGLVASRGRAIAFLDADDLWLADNLSCKVEALEESGRGLVHSDMEVIDAESRPTGDVISGRDGEVLVDLLLWNGCSIPAPSSILMRRSLALELGGFDEELSTAADQDFFFRVAARGPVARIARPLGQYRLHDQNMHQNIARMERDHWTCYRKAERAGLFPSQELRRRAFARLELILAGSWWVDGGRPLRGATFALRAVVRDPRLLGTVSRQLGRRLLGRGRGQARDVRRSPSQPIRADAIEHRERAA